TRRGRTANTVGSFGGGSLADYRIWGKNVMSTVLLAVLLAGSTSTTYVEVPPSGGGLISGKITYDGKPPAPAKLSISMDRRYCGASRDDDTWLIGPDQGVKNVVVYLSDIKVCQKMR